MGKKTWISIGVSLVILIIAACAVWLNLTRHYENNNPLDHIPTSVLCIYKINGTEGHHNQTKTTNYFADLHEIIGNKHLERAYHDADSLLNCANIVSPLARHRDVYVATFDVFEYKQNALFAIKLNNYAEGIHIKNSLHSIESLLPTDTIIADNDILALKIDNRDYFIAIIEGCLFISDNAQIVEHLYNTEIEKLTDDASFTTIERTASSNALASIFLNTQTFNMLLQNGIDFTKMAKWIELDLSFDKKSLSANGFASSSNNSQLIALAANKPMRFDIDKYIPSDAKIFISYVAGNRGLSNEAFVHQLAQNGHQVSYRARQEELFKQYNVDIEDRLSQIFNGDLALFSTSNTIADSTNTCLIVVSDNATITQASLNDLSCTLHNIEIPRQVGEIKTTPDMTIPIYEAFDSDDELFFLNELFSYVPRKYYIRYENTIFIADNIKMLEHALYENQLSRTLGNDADFRNFRTTYSEENICFLFMNSDVMLRYAKLHSTSEDDLKLQHAVGNFYGMGIQISALGGLKLPYISLSIHHEPDRLQMPPTAWQSRVDTTLIGRPWGVINHNTGETEYLVQDAKNRIHLINPQGLVLWSVKLDSPIKGDVTQIDYYNNKKLQLLFATNDHIYLIDRNGRNTADFPIRLQAEAAGGVSYIDYNNPSDFRLFIAGTNKFIHLYNKNGERIQGWEMGRTDGIANTPVRHYVTGNKDYLIMADEYKYYITDRRGNERIKLPLLAPNHNREVTLIRKNTPQAAFVMATADGLFASVEIPSGKTTTKHIEGMNKDLPFDMIYNKEKQLFAVITPKKILTLNEDGKKVGDYNIYLSSVDDVKLLADGTIALWDKDEKLAYRYSFEGELLTGYPLPASSPFVMNSQYGVNNIVVISNDGSLYSFLRK